MFKVIQWEAKTLRWWLSQRERIDMDPPYQRSGKIWPKADKQFLIDSVLNDFDVPKIYVADFTFANSPLNVKRLPYAIIDGKQRLEAFNGFFKDEFELKSDIIFEENPSINIGGLLYSELKRRHPEIAEKFDNFGLTVMRVITDDELKITDLFVRLNRSKPLTGAELRNAMSGLVTDLTRIIAGHKFFTTRIKFSTQRKEQSNAAGKLLLIEFRGRLVDTKKVNLDRFVLEGKKSESIDLQPAADRVNKTLEHMCEIFEEKDPLLGGAGIVPVYYWFVRKIEHERHKDIRLFLAEFNGALVSGPEPGSVFDDSSALDRFKIYNRSANDQASLDERFKMLIQFFEKWTASNGT
jgi:hypothetical protein